MFVIKILARIHFDQLYFFHDLDESVFIKFGAFHIRTISDN